MPVLFLCALVIAVSGCRGEKDGSVRVNWQARNGDVASLNDAQAPVYSTVVYVDNATGATLRDARLRFRPNEARNAPIGFSVGTVTSVATVFEGANHVWAVGDLKPGTKLEFPLQLWFSAAYGAPPESVELRMELVSPDLEGGAVESNPLTVRLRP